MAHSVQTRTLQNDGMYIIKSVVIVGDGASGELSAQTLIDPASDTATNPRDPAIPVRYAIEEAWHDGDPSISVLLLFDATTDDAAWVLGSSANNHVDFRSFRGIKDPKSSGFTGKVLWTTLGLATSAKRFGFIVRLRKVYD